MNAKEEKKTHAAESNGMLIYVANEIEKHDGKLTNLKLNQYIETSFRWEQVNYVSPLGKMSCAAETKEWRLLYKRKDSTQYLNHIKVKKSTMANAGYGLFADRKFIPEDTISVYQGELVRRKSTHSPYAMDYSDLEVIDPKYGIKDGASLYLGCHFANDVTHPLGTADGRKKTNAKFVDLRLVATSDIRRDTEIFVEYNTK